MALLDECARGFSERAAGALDLKDADDRARQLGGVERRREEAIDAILDEIGKAPDAEACDRRAARETFDHGVGRSF
ncbi:MAG TPA: hypothetical protein VEO95_08725 [Chthoniobacteraceae bacterium]|nr:hypothetical protein [Chthoniobacteraceae bacterium]